MLFIILTKKKLYIKKKFKYSLFYHTTIHLNYTWFAVVNQIKYDDIFFINKFVELYFNYLKIKSYFVFLVLYNNILRNLNLNTFEVLH